MPFTLKDNIVTRTFSRVLDATKNRTGTWWTCIILHDILAIFYFVWFVVGVTVALWVEIPPSRFGQIVEYAFGPVTLLGGMFFYIVLVGSMSLIVLRRPSFFTSTREKIIGALYLLCIYALGVYASNMFYISYRPESRFEPSMYIVQMNVKSAVLGFPISIILGILAVILMSQNPDDGIGGIQLPGDE